MPKIPELLLMLKSGLHFGHRESKWHPKMEPFIFTVRNGVHIIDLERTVESLKKSLDFVTNTVAKGGTILFLGTKRQAAPIVRKYAEEAGMPYVTERWLGGTLTNFSVIQSLVKKLKKLEDQEKSDDYEKKYNKKERLDFHNEIERLEQMVGGLRDMQKQPDALFVLDIKEEKTAIREANRMNIPTVAVVDTNANPETVTFPIPANDDATKAIDMLTKLFGEAVKEGMEKRAVEGGDTKKEVESKKENEG